MKVKVISKIREWRRNITLIPVFIAAICFFSPKAIAQNNLSGVENPISDKDSMIIYGKGVSQKLLAEYQDIANKYLEKSSIGNPDGKDKFYWKSDYLSEEDWTRLYVIFVQMTDDQKNEQMISFREPPRFVNIPPSYRMYLQPPQRFYDLWIEEKNVISGLMVKK